MAKIPLPKQFLSYYERPEIAWFSVEDDTYSPAIIVLEYEGNTGEMMIGVKDHHGSTYNHNEVISMTYVKNKKEDSEEYDEYFNVYAGKEGNKYYIKLVARDNSKKDLPVIKFSTDTENNINNILTLLKGETGETGLSFIDLYRKEIDSTMDEDTIVSNLDIIYNFLKNKDKYLTILNEKKEKLTNIKEQVACYVDELPVGAILIANECPYPNSMWLPFWVDDTEYKDENYPDLAAIVKSWDDAFKVDDENFRLYVSSLPNPYLVVAGGNRFSGELISQAIPDADGALDVSASFPAQTTLTFTSVTANRNSWFGYIKTFLRYVTPVYESSGAILTYNTDLSLCSDLYKNVDRIFAPSVGWKFWIKAKSLQTYTTTYTYEFYDHIEVAIMPSKMYYYEGEEFDPTDMIVYGVYSSGEAMALSDYTYDLVSSDGVWIHYTQTIKGVEQTFTCLCEINVATNISISGDVPSYIPGQVFSKDDLEVVFNYADGTTRVCEDYDYTIDSFTEEKYYTLSITKSVYSLTEQILVGHYVYYTYEVYVQGYNDTYTASDNTGLQGDWSEPLNEAVKKYFTPEYLVANANSTITFYVSSGQVYILQGYEGTLIFSTYYYTMKRGYMKSTQLYIGDVTRTLTEQTVKDATFTVYMSDKWDYLRLFNEQNGVYTTGCVRNIELEY